MKALSLLFMSVVLTAAACGSRDLSPADFDAAHEPCRFCRMTGSNGRSAAQVVAPGEEARYFDDIGCLRSYLQKAPALTASAVVYVTDHRTGEWVRADRAVYAQSQGTPTPMGSHVLAYVSAESRDADAIGADRKPMSVADVFAEVSVPWSQKQ